MMTGAACFGMPLLFRDALTFDQDALGQCADLDAGAGGVGLGEVFAVDGV